MSQYWNSGKIGTLKELDAALTALVLDCDVPDSILFNRHRKGEDDFYFLVNSQDTTQDITAVFRVAGKQPEIWDPMTGETIDAPNWRQLPDGRTEVHLSFQSHDSIFVVFRRATTSLGKTTPTPKFEKLVSLEDQWTVTFDPTWGSKDPVQWNRLSLGNENANEEIKHFSGTATYQTTFDLNPSGGSLMLDLGQVEVMARVTLNGKSLGTLWKPPFRIEITDAARQGSNELEVEVTNLWVNRLVGDERFGKSDEDAAWLIAGKAPPSDAPRKSVVVHSLYNKNSKLVPSGLIGPVTVLRTSH